MMVRKNEQDFVGMLNVAIQELANTGFIDKVIAKYEDSPKMFLRRRPAYAE